MHCVSFYRTWIIFSITKRSNFYVLLEKQVASMKFLLFAQLIRWSLVINSIVLISFGYFFIEIRVKILWRHSPSQPDTRSKESSWIASIKLSKLRPTNAPNSFWTTITVITRNSAGVTSMRWPLFRRHSCGRDRPFSNNLIVSMC